MRTLGVSKAGEIRALAMWLDQRNFLWTIMPSVGLMPRLAVDDNLARLGLRKGLPDILIFDRPGIALYVTGSAGNISEARLSPAQTSMVQGLRDQRWLVGVVRGAQHAQLFIQDAGL